MTLKIFVASFEEKRSNPKLKSAAGKIPTLGKIVGSLSAPLAGSIAFGVSKFVMNVGRIFMKLFCIWAARSFVPMLAYTGFVRCSKKKTEIDRVETIALKQAEEVLFQNFIGKNTKFTAKDICTI